MLLGIICTILGVLGVYGTFSGSLILVLIGGTAGIIENIVGVVSKQQNNLITATLASVIGIIYAISSGIPFWIGVFIGMCFESTIMGFIGFSALLFMIIKSK